MKYIQKYLTLGFVIYSLLPLSAEEAVSGSKESKQTSPKLTGDYDLKETFNPKELRSLVQKTSRNHNDNRRLQILILRAGIEKDQSFQDLLKMPKLRTAKNVDLALSGYDFMLNNSEQSLDRILAQLATEDIGADVDTIVVLSVLDEWDRTVRAFRKHFVYTDGAGGSCKSGFMTVRAYLYPKKYKKMRSVIEAPIIWNQKLLPQSK